MDWSIPEFTLDLRVYRGLRWIAELHSHFLWTRLSSSSSSASQNIRKLRIFFCEWQHMYLAVRIVCWSTGYSKNAKVSHFVISGGLAFFVLLLTVIQKNESSESIAQGGGLGYLLYTRYKCTLVQSRTWFACGLQRCTQWVCGILAARSRKEKPIHDFMEGYVNVCGGEISR